MSARVASSKSDGGSRRSWPGTSTSPCRGLVEVEPIGSHCARRPSQESAARPALVEDLTPLRSGVDVLDLGGIDAGLRRSSDRRSPPSGTPRATVLPSRSLSRPCLPLREGEVEDVVGAHLEDRDEGTALLDVSEKTPGEDSPCRPGRSTALVPAVARSARFHGRLDVAEVAHLRRPSRGSRRALRACRVVKPSGPCSRPAARPRCCCAAAPATPGGLKPSAARSMRPRRVMRPAANR